MSKRTYHSSVKMIVQTNDAVEAVPLIMSMASCFRTNKEVVLALIKRFTGCSHRSMIFLHEISHA